MLGNYNISLENGQIKQIVLTLGNICVRKVNNQLYCKDFNDKSNLEQPDNFTEDVAYISGLRSIYSVKISGDLFC